MNQACLPLNHRLLKPIGSWGLAVTLLGLATGPVLAASPMNTVNDGRIVKGGNYYNTSDGKTTFMNSGSGGLWVRKDAVVRGLEVDATGKLTNNGGTMHFVAPNSVVRVDGTINVNGVINGQGAYLGNGGRVLIDAAYLYQSGKIYANGINGGMAQFNVGSAVFASGSDVQAKGFGGNGGIISVHSDGIVDVAHGAAMSTSGKTAAGMTDSNLINLEAGVIQNSGTLRADGVVLNAQTDGSRGGTIRLVASGNTHLNTVNAALDNAQRISANDPDLTPTFTSTQAQTLKNAAAKVVQVNDGKVVIYGKAENGVFTPAVVSANGSGGATATNNDTVENTASRAGDGGNIILSAMNQVVNYGLIAANGGQAAADRQIQGGNGGTIAVVSNGGILNGAIPVLRHQGVISANGGAGSTDLATGGATRGGNGGKGGIIALGYNTQAMNAGIIQTKGGAGGNGHNVLTVTGGNGGAGGTGGIIALSGDGNPTCCGVLDVRGGNGGNGKIAGAAGGQSGIIISPNPGSLGGTQVARQADGGAGGLPGQAPTSGKTVPITEQTRQSELLTHNDMLVLLTRNIGDPTSDLSARTGSIRSVGDPKNTGIARQQMLTRDSGTSGFPYRHLVIGSSAHGKNLSLGQSPPHLFDLGNGEGVYLSGLKTSTLITDGQVDAYNPWYAGSLAILASGNINSGEGGFVAGRSLHLASSKGSIFNTNYIGGENIVLKAGLDITNGWEHSIQSEGVNGGTQRYIANRNFSNTGYISTGETMFNNAPTYGGNIYILAGNRISHGADADFGLTPELTAKATSAATDIGGYIRMQAPEVNMMPSNLTDVSGAMKNGQVEIIRQ